MVNKKKKKYKVKGNLLRSFRDSLNKSQLEIVDLMKKEGLKIGLRKYKEAEQSKQMSLEIIETIARWYNEVNATKNVKLSENNITTETISSYSLSEFDDFIKETYEAPIQSKLNYPKDENISLYAVKDFYKFISILNNAKNQKTIYNFSPSIDKQIPIISEALELVKELKKKNLSFKDLDKEDSFDLSSSTEYLKSIKKFEKLILDLKDAEVGFYIGLYRQPRLDVAPVDITKITFKAQEDQYSTGDYIDNNVPEDYYPPEPEGFGAYQTSIKQRIYAIFVFDNPHKTLEVIYSNNFHIQNLKDLLSEDKFTSSGFKSLCFKKMEEYYKKKYNYSSNISSKLLKVKEGVSHSRGETYEDWYAGIQEHVDDIIELLLNDPRLKNYAGDLASDYNFENRKGREKWYKEVMKSHDAMREDAAALFLYYEERISKVVELMLTGGKALQEALNKALPHYYGVYSGDYGR